MIRTLNKPDDQNTYQTDILNVYTSFHSAGPVSDPRYNRSRGVVGPPAASPRSALLQGWRPGRGASHVLFVLVNQSY